jgi:DNA-directed RNA polymerase specialized sigma24 family protein
MPATAQEIRAAIESLTRDDLLRLRQFAVWRMRGLGRNGGGRDHEDLIQEAVVRTVAGDRRWNQRAVTLAAHLVGAMRSISNHWATEVSVRAGEGLPDSAGVALIEQLASAAIDPETELAAKQEIKAIEKLLAGDAAAVRVLDCIRRGLSGPETQLATGYSRTEYETVMKRIRRKLRRWSSDGVKTNGT